jgi:hypothetical protein
MDREGGIEAVIKLATLEDIECQEYAAFSLAHLASNRDFQVMMMMMMMMMVMMMMLMVLIMLLDAGTGQ